jgi:hypothetical protein
MACQDTSREGRSADFDVFEFREREYAKYSMTDAVSELQITRSLPEARGSIPL